MCLWLELDPANPSQITVLSLACHQTSQGFVLVPPPGTPPVQKPSFNLEFETPSVYWQIFYLSIIKEP